MKAMKIRAAYRRCLKFTFFFLMCGLALYESIAESSVLHFWGNPLLAPNEEVLSILVIGAVLLYLTRYQKAAQQPVESP